MEASLSGMAFRYGNIIPHITLGDGAGCANLSETPYENREKYSVDKQNAFDRIYVDPDSGIPLWFQLRNRLVFLISSGHYQPGDKLPTVRELAVSLGVNYNTVSKVYQDIERDGYIVSKRGKGTFVAERDQEKQTEDLNEVETLVDEFIRQCVELGVPVEDIAPLVNKRIELSSI